MSQPGDHEQPTRTWPPGRAGAARRWLALGLAAVAILATLVAGAAWLAPGFDNPFAKDRTDRSQPVLLQSVRELSRYVAVEGTFQQVVDIQESRQNIPEFLLNDRTLFVAAGTVEAYVDFSSIAAGAVRVSEDGRTATITLPAPELGKASLDMQKSYVVTRETGVLNKVGDLIGGDPNRQQQVYQKAEQQITAAAQASGLAEQARDNTRKMLEGLLRSLGYATVTVEFAAP